MNSKEFSAFYSKIEVCDYFGQGYIYFYSDNISLCRKNLHETSKESLESIIKYCALHHITATIVLTKVVFWKMRQLNLNQKLSMAGCHMSRETLLNLYNCNAFLLSQTNAWLKNWEHQPVFKAALEVKKRGRKLF